MVCFNYQVVYERFILMSDIYALFVIIAEV